MLSSLLFAAIHLPTNELHAEDSLKTVALWLLYAGALSTSAFFMSLDFLTPLYDKGGLAASLCGHICWNTVFCLPDVAKYLWSELRKPMQQALRVQQRR